MDWANAKFNHNWEKHWSCKNCCGTVVHKHTQNNHKDVDEDEKDDSVIGDGCEEAENHVWKIFGCVETAENLYGEEKIQDAIHYAKDLKDRYTVLWMYDDLSGAENI